MSHRVLTGRTALFGKIPAHGDFVARGCPPGLRTALDRWLTAHLAAQAPGAWPADGIRATLDLRGISLSALILPGRDRAGRRFPLACCHLPGLPRAEADAWCSAALPAARAALDGDTDADGLLAALPCLPAAATPAEPGLWVAGGDALPAEPAAPALAALMQPVSSD